MENTIVQIKIEKQKQYKKLRSGAPRTPHPLCSTCSFWVFAHLGKHRNLLETPRARSINPLCLFNPPFIKESKWDNIRARTLEFDLLIRQNWDRIQPRPNLSRFRSSQKCSPAGVEWKILPSLSMCSVSKKRSSRIWLSLVFAQNP